MHVKALHVTRYGPMTPFEHDAFGPFTLVYGPNEQGKTLLIDALVKLLFKKELKKSRERRFGNMRRVAEQPEGFVVLRSHAEEVKLEADDTLSKRFAVDLGPDDFRNVFLIRDSDLRLDEEKEYYNHITEKLTGLRSSEIHSLLKIIQRRGRLRAASADSGLVNSVEHGKWSDRIRDTHRVIDQIASLRDDLAFVRYDELGVELVDLRRRRRRLEEERERARAAERRRQFEGARDALSELVEIERELDGMADVDYRTFTEWQRLKVEREHLDKDVERAEKQSERLTRDRDRARRALEEQRASVADADRRLRAVEKELAQRLNDYQHERLEFRRWDTVSGIARRAFIAGASVFAVALVAYVIRPSNVVGAVGAVALLVALRTGWGLLRHHRSRGDLERRAEELCEHAARMGVPVESAHELASAIEDLGRDVSSRRDEERAREAALERVTADAAALGENLEEKRRRAAEIDAEVAAIKARTRAESIEAYQNAVDRRRSLEASRRVRRDLLQRLVPVDATGDEAAPAWRAAIDAALSGEVAGVSGDTVDPERAARVEAEIRDIEGRESELAGSRAKGDKQIYNAQMKVAELHVLEDVPRCRTVHDLEHLAGRLEAFCRRIADEQALAQEAIGILYEVDAEERERVGDLFGPSAAVSRTFREITDGRYRSVTYDVETDQIFVERADGRSLRATALSGGAYDQLYLAIRLGIADKMLPTSKGFFIMDDPFIKADAQRLDNLMETLRRVVRSGWQVLYFSAKREVLDALADDIRRGDVTQVEIDRTLFPPSAWSAGARATGAASTDAKAPPGRAPQP